MLKKLKSRIKDYRAGGFINEESLLKHFSHIKSIVEDLVSDLLDYRKNHEKLHKNNDANLEKRLKRFEKRLKNLELKS